MTATTAGARIDYRRLAGAAVLSARLTLGEMSTLTYSMIWRGRSAGKIVTLRFCNERADMSHVSATGADGNASYFTFGGSSTHWPESDPRAFVDAYNAWHAQQQQRAAA
jgi:hypothetical protein